VIDTLHEFNGGLIVYDKATLLREIQRSTFRLIYRPLVNSEDQEPIDFVIDCAITAGRCTLVIDEVDQFSSSYYMSPALYYAIHYGRHYNLNIIMASRQPNRIRTDITAQADNIISFQCQGSVVDYIQQFTDKDISSILPSLIDHNFFVVLGNFSLDKLSHLA
jgi:hypothetical protein